jgi:hypothetical protein
VYSRSLHPFIASRNKAFRAARPEGAKVALYFASAMLILIGLIQNFQAAAGGDVAPHVDMTALGILLVVVVTAAFLIATFGRRH